MTYATDVAALTSAVRSLQLDVLALSQANATLTQAVITGTGLGTGTGTGTAATSLAALTTTGDVPYRMASGALGRWGVGPNGAMATVVGGLPTWVVPALGGTVVAGATVPWGNVTAKPIFGNAALLDAAPGTAQASGVQVVTGADPRLGDARSPTAHQHADAVAGGASGLMTGTSLAALNTLLLTTGTASGGGVTTQPAGTNSTLPASTAFVQTALANVLTNPTMSGTVSVPTLTAGANNTQAASTAFVAAAVAQGKADLVGAAPAILDTFAEVAALLATASGDTLAVGYALAVRLRFDIATQGLSAVEQHNALTNLGIQDGPTQGQILAALGYAPLNKAGDTMTGALVVDAAATVNGPTTVAGVLSVSQDSSFTSTGGLLVSKGSTLQRPAGTAVAGQIRFNSDQNWFEGFNGQYWFAMGGTPIGALFAVDYTVVGPMAAPITSILCTSPPIFPNGVTADYSGVWTSTLVVPSTNVLMTSLVFGNLQGMTGTLSITGLTALAFLGFPSLTTLVGSLAVGSMPALTGMAFPLLTAVGANFSVANNIAFAAMSFPLLGRVGGDFSIAALAGCTTISCPLLKVIEGNFSMGGLTACTTVNFSGLTEVKGKISVSTGAALTNLSFGSLERIGTSLTGGNAITIGPLLAGVTTFQLSNNLKQINGSIYIDCALTVVAVDALLIRLASLNGSGGTTAFSNLSVTLTGVSSPPSPAGLTAKNTLMGRGCAVVTN